MNIYRLQYTRTIYRITRDVVEYFEATDNSAAVTIANNRFPAEVTNKKLYNIGTGVSLG